MKNLRESIKIILAFCLTIGFVIGEICLLVFSFRYSNATEGLLVSCAVFTSVFVTSLIFYFLVLFENSNKKGRKDEKDSA